jgi:FkbM family methyltransferase
VRCAHRREDDRRAAAEGVRRRELDDAAREPTVGERGVELRPPEGEHGRRPRTERQRLGGLDASAESGKELGERGAHGTEQTISPTEWPQSTAEKCLFFRTMTQPVDRRNVLLGVLTGVGIGATSGYASASLAAPPPRRELVTIPSRSFPESLGHISYAQQGEDLAIASVFLHTRADFAKLTYLDIGAHEPIVNSNTFLFYPAGARGVLVEPNPALTPKLRETRPGDQVLEVGIGAGGKDEEADYYVIEGDGQLNTFSKEQADAIAKARGPSAIKQVLKRQLVDVNRVIVEHLGGRAPDLLSIDTEGLDLAILRTLDFARFRPRVVCAETSEVDGSVDQELIDLMRAKGYDVRGGTFVNTIFVDGAITRLTGR